MWQKKKQMKSIPHSKMDKAHLRLKLFLNSIFLAVTSLSLRPLFNVHLSSSLSLVNHFPWPFLSCSLPLLFHTQALFQLQSQNMWIRVRVRDISLLPVPWRSHLFWTAPIRLQESLYFIFKKAVAAGVLCLPDDPWSRRRGHISGAATLCLCYTVKTAARDRGCDRMWGVSSGCE